MQLTGKDVSFRKQSFRSNPYVALVLLMLVVAGIFVIREIQERRIVSPFEPTPLPTRNLNSFTQEAETHFAAGNLPAAIATYQRALELAPDDYHMWSELARIQTYSSALLTTDSERSSRLAEALQSTDKAIALYPDDSSSHAIRSFVLDWYANPALVGDQAQNYLGQAEQEAVRALQLDNQNTLALAYYSEILVDQQKWLQANQYIQQALDRDATLMDVHRIYAYVQESLGNYGEAIKSYKKAAEINPNLTFLYLAIGNNYRILKQFALALEFYAKAANINEQLGIKDPIPYISISKTYVQMGEFFAASRNIRKALSYSPNSPDVYGQLGIVYFNSRNYEGAIPALKCAVRGCTAEESCAVRQCDAAQDQPIIIKGLPLSSNTVVYYYTYGSVLAGMHRAGNDYCSEAVKVLGEVRDGFSSEPTIISIVQSSEDICASYGFTR